MDKQRVRLTLLDFRFENSNSVSGHNGKKPSGFWSTMFSVALIIKAVADYIGDNLLI